MEHLPLVVTHQSTCSLVCIVYVGTSIYVGISDYLHRLKALLIKDLKWSTDLINISCTEQRTNVDFDVAALRSTYHCQNR